MSVSKPPVVASSVALFAALSLIPSQGLARDGRRVGEDVIYEMAPMAPNSTQDIIFEMAPLKPVKGAAQASKPAPKPAVQPSPAVAAKPELKPTLAPAAAVQTAPAQPVQAPVAEAAKPATPSVAEHAVAPQPTQAAGEQPAPAAQEAAAPEPVVAQAPTIVEPAPIGPPIMILNPPRKSIAALSAPPAAFDQKAIDLQGGAAAPALVPSLDPTVHEEPPLAAQAPAPETADAGVAIQTPEAAAPAEEAENAGQGAETPPQDDLEARVGAIVAEGVVGPAQVRLADRATLWLPAGRIFLPPEAAKKLAKEAGLEWRAGIQGMIAPTGGGLEWLAPVELVEDGYIKTGAPESLQADGVLAAFQASLPEINAQRARAGEPPVTLDGWLTPPALDAKGRLSACANISTPNSQNGQDGFFNCEAWALGRNGAIKVGLADGGEMAERLKNEAAALAETIVFDHGATYEEFDAATDPVAPYTAADLLTRDVAAKTVKPVLAAAEEGAPAPSILDRISGLLYPALFGAIALGLYVYLKRRREEAGKEEAQQQEAESAPAEALHPETSEPAKQAPASLLARLLPSLHARFAKKTERALESAPVGDSRLNSTLSALKSRFAGLLEARKLQKSKAAPRADAVSSGVPEEEPVSALKKLAARMRRTSEEAPPPPVNVARIVRTPRTSGGAAVAVAAEEFVAPLIVDHEPEKAPAEGLLEPELIEPGQNGVQIAEPQHAVAEIAPAASQIAADDGGFGLVEPGAAEPAAIEAARARLATEE
ncbi:DUF2167 domain-containing protein [Methylocystis sp. JR02]|uniref:DUF2167 domain-containing protein n=1 Tax=Methylocystis sp. JR02 TaxID=3046284 RepID=UPI0024B9D874|nr:DUF2167 domain-containing protein [Methylocystis sp. JR02]MDJ0447914.1 DUF2167 domain-containing protein [Methylocystis sp. JR02]